MFYNIFWCSIISSDLIFVIFLHKCTFLAQFFSTWKRVNCGKISQNFSKFPKISPHDNFSPQILFVIFVTNMSSGYFSLFSLSNCFVLFTLISFYFCFFFCTHSAGLTLWALLYQYVAIVAQLFLMWNILASSVPERSTPYRDPFTDDQLTDHFGRLTSVLNNKYHVLDKTNVDCTQMTILCVKVVIKEKL